MPVPIGASVSGLPGSDSQCSSSPPPSITRCAADVSAPTQLTDLACPGHAAATTCSSPTASSVIWRPKLDPGRCSSWCSATRGCAGARLPLCEFAISTWPADVRRAFSDVGGRVVLGTPKSHQSRTVPVPRFLARELAAAITGKHADDLVFTMPGGSVMRLSNWRRASFLPARARAGLSGRFRIHDLRHTAASLMVQAGYPPKMLQEIMGHASITTTLDLYGHLYPGDMDRYADRLDSAADDAGKAKIRPDDDEDEQDPE